MTKTHMLRNLITLTTLLILTQKSSQTSPNSRPFIQIPDSPPPDCKITQTHVTLGDYFSPSRKNASDYYTISTVIRGENCNPTLEITKITGTKLQIPITKSTKFFSKEANYSATAYFFSIPISLSPNQNTYQIKTTIDATLVKNLPAQGAGNPPGESNIVFLADMDYSLLSIPLINRMATWSQNSYDLILHGGDFAYDVDSLEGRRGDVYFEKMSEIATSEIPYIVTPGNHERVANGQFFNYRFKMPGGGDYKGQGTNYFSFDYKGVHYVTVNFDYIFILNRTAINDVFNWMKNDLEAANSNPEINYIIFYSHRPMYCPVFPTDCCKSFYHTRPFEMLLRKYNADLMIFAHVHAIIRLKKIKDFLIMSGEEADKQPLQVLSGSAGASHKSLLAPLDPMGDYQYVGLSAFLRLKINGVRIVGEFVYSENGEVMDSFEILNRRRAKEE